MRMVVVIGSPFPRRYLNYTFIALLDFKRIIFILLSLRRGFHLPPPPFRPTAASQGGGYTALHVLSDPS